MEVEQELRNLGFTSNEARVYLTLLRLGRSQAGRLARECNLERTSTYNSLKRLIGEGVVSYILEANKRVFSASDPRKIVEMFKEKGERASLLLPDLVNLRKYEKEKENILKFKGYSGIKTVMGDILRSCKECDEYLIFGSENQLSERMPVFAQIFVARKDKKKLRARILIRRGLKGRRKKMSKYTRARYVPSDVMSPANINVYSNKVAILVWSEIPEAIIIDNAGVAATFKSYFELMWKIAKK
jgi:HTH-type transcriptional regulator, sugar sensing transcriptional regulator